MNEESPPGLLSLPAEVLIVIGDYLSPRELLAVSGLCRYLRSVFNVNSIWRRYTHDGRVSRGLDSTVSLVEPKFEIPNIRSLEPLCEHRLHFLKQSRLLNNVRQGKFVEHRIELPNYISELEQRLHKHNITYGNKYLFTKDRENNVEFMRIFDIEDLPTLLMTVNLENHGQNVHWSPIQVEDDKLFVRREDWIDIYDIKLPESLDLLYSINANRTGNQIIDEVLVINKFIFVENLTSNVVHVWDLSNGSQCSDISPKISGPDFRIIGYSQNEQLVVMSVGMRRGEPSNPHVFVYDTHLKEFSSFKPVLNKKAVKGSTCYGLIDSDHVVLLIEKQSSQSLLVFDHNSSLVCEKYNVEGVFDDARILGGNLVLLLPHCVRVVDLKSLQTVWEGTVHLADSDSEAMNMDVVYISSLISLIVIQKYPFDVEIWDLKTRRKILSIPEGDVALNDACSKLIVYNYEYMRVLSFW